MGVTRFLTVERLEAVVRAALLEGRGGWQAFKSGSLEGRARRVFVLDTKHDCIDPVPFELHSRISANHRKKVMPLTVIGSARCRKCERCLSMRGWLWRQKAMAEYGLWPVTWFGTVTMAPEQHYELDARIARRLAGKAVRFASLSEGELFAERVKEFGGDLQRYLKRLRKGAADREKPQLRYLCVAEMHDGVNTSEEMRRRPHFHLLIHEKVPGRLVLGSPAEAIQIGEHGECIRKKYQLRGTWRDGVFLRDDAWMRLQWPYGFTKFQWAENAQAASYLCKYLSKASDARVRASLCYGRIDPAQFAPVEESA